MADQQTGRNAGFSKSSRRAWEKPTHTAKEEGGYLQAQGGFCCYGVYRVAIY